MEGIFLVYIIYSLIPYAILYFIFKSKGQETGIGALIIYRLLSIVSVNKPSITILILALILGLAQGLVAWYAFVKTNAFWKYIILSGILGFIVMELLMHVTKGAMPLVV